MLVVQEGPGELATYYSRTAASQTIRCTHATFNHGVLAGFSLCTFAKAIAEILLADKTGTSLNVHRSSSTSSHIKYISAALTTSSIATPRAFPIFRPRVDTEREALGEQTMETSARLPFVD